MKKKLKANNASDQHALTSDQRLAMLVIPVLLFGVLGTSSVSAYGGDLTNEERDAVIEAHGERESGNYGRARVILERAGLLSEGGENSRNTTQPSSHERRAAIKNAVVSKDYTAYTEAVRGTPFAEHLSPDTFVLLVKAHALHEAGKYTEAKRLLSGVQTDSLI